MELPLFNTGLTYLAERIAEIEDSYGNKPEVRYEHIHYPSPLVTGELSRATFRWYEGFQPVVITATPGWWKIYMGSRQLAHSQEGYFDLHIMRERIRLAVLQDTDDRGAYDDD